jgi:thymidylate synthase
MIHTIANMRSSDLWLGWVYDVFNFTMITAWVALRYRERMVEVNQLNAPFTPAPQLGKLFVNAGSQHIYEQNVQACRELIHDNTAWHYKSLSLSDFDSPSHLMSHLVALRDRDWAKVVHLKELEQHV